MTLWLTLLLVWTTGIPAALFITASVAAALNERRAARLPSLRLRTPSPRCGRRVHGCGRLAVVSSHPLRVRVGGRRRY
jgi:hypothetical protein